MAAMACATGFDSTNPAQEPQEKNGEHPAQSFSLDWPFVDACFIPSVLSQFRSVQHGRADKISTIIDNIRQRIFTAQRY